MAENKEVKNVSEEKLLDDEDLSEVTGAIRGISIEDGDGHSKFFNFDPAAGLNPMQASFRRPYKEDPSKKVNAIP